MLNNITLRQIQGFLLAGELLSFKRAAQEMHITPSAFSQLIQELESALELRLFDRTTRRVCLTQAGDVMHVRMKRGAVAINDACEEARSIARLKSGRISVGTLSSLAIGVVTRALGELRKGYPDLKVSMQEDHNVRLLERVEQGEIDFAVCAQSEEVPGLCFEQLFDDELVAVMRRCDEKDRGGFLRWSALQDLPIILLARRTATQEQITEALSVNQVTREPDYEVANMFTALSMVRAGFGVTFIPSMAIGEVSLAGLRWKRLQKPVPRRRIAICRRCDRTASPAAAKLEELLRLEANRVRQRVATAFLK